ncbi:MAG: hypothetical protein R3C05_19855 [Pirellulaceae bacterium]
MSQREMKRILFSQAMAPLIMKYYRHDFPNVKDYLHHREPYALIESIESVLDDRIQTSIQISGDEFYLQGHFPGAPIVPGAMMQEMTTQTAGILVAARFNPMERYNTEDPFFNEYALGVLIRVKAARYRSFARPGDRLLIDVVLVDQIAEVFEFKGEIRVGDRLIMSNHFQLANIPSQTLQGDDVGQGRN